MTKPEVPHARYGYRSIEGESHQFKGRQQGLRNRLDDYKTNGCGDPPNGAWDWATRDLPEADKKLEQINVSKMAESGVKVGIAIGFGYIAYRVIRMIPSLFPALWPTIPANAAIP